MGVKTAMTIFNTTPAHRPPAVAGMFYPGPASELEQSVELYLQQAPVEPLPKRPKAMIVPHAGYIYSAPVAASAYKLLQPFADEISQVILLGPSHRVPFTGIASSSAEAFDTPLGAIPLNRNSIDRINQLPFVVPYDEAHQQEHSLEVQLPFLQKVLSDFTLVPLVIGQASDEQVGQLIEYLWDEPGTLFLISSDLSHYLDYDTARQYDFATMKAIEQLEPQKIQYEQACGRTGIAGLLLAAKNHHLKVKTLDIRNSGDTAGSKDQVVGYGSWVFV